MDAVLEQDPLDLVGMLETPQLDSWVFMSDVCKHCTHAGCLDACPTGALIRTEFETVIVQPDVCNGCGYCIPACPFGVIDRDHDDGRAAKCTLCYDRLEDGLEPACAKSCPTDSITFGPYDELVEIAGRRVDARCTSAASRARTSTAPATPPARPRRRAGRVLPADQAARGLRPAVPRRVADPGERRPGDAGGDGRRAAGGGRASPRRSWARRAPRRSAGGAGERPARAGARTRTSRPSAPRRAPGRRRPASPSARRAPAARTASAT